MNSTSDSTRFGQCVKTPDGKEDSPAQRAISLENGREEAESDRMAGSIVGSINFDHATIERCQYLKPAEAAPSKSFFKSASKFFGWQFENKVSIPGNLMSKKNSKKMSKLVDSIALSIGDLSEFSKGAISLGNLADEVFKPRTDNDCETNLGASDIFEFNMANNLAPAASRRRSSRMSLTRDHYPAVVNLIDPSRDSGSFSSRESLSLGSIGGSLSLSRNSSLVGYGRRSSSMDVYGNHHQGTCNAIRELMSSKTFFLDTIDCDEEDGEYQNKDTDAIATNDVDTYYLVGKRDSLSIYHEKKMRKVHEACGKRALGNKESSISVDIHGRAGKMDCFNSHLG